MGDSKFIFDEPEFKVSVSEESNGVASLIFSGYSFSDDFMNNLKTIEKAIDGLPQNHLFIDVEGVQNPNSRFVILLLALFNSGKHIALKTPPKFLYDLLDMLGILGCFRIFEDLESFLAEEVS